MGDPMAADIIHTRAIVNHTRRLFLCLAYFIGCVTAMYLENHQMEDATKWTLINKRQFVQLGSLSAWFSLISHEAGFNDAKTAQSPHNANLIPSCFNLIFS
jgi:hypothetical protein